MIDTFVVGTSDINGLSASGSLGNNSFARGAGSDNLCAEINDFCSGGSGDDQRFDSAHGVSILRCATRNDVVTLVITEVPPTPNIVDDFNPSQDKTQILFDKVKSFEDLVSTYDGANLLIHLTRDSTPWATVLDDDAVFSFSLAA